MINLTMFLNTLKGPDIAFFIICAVVIVAIVAIYFLIPVFNKKHYQEQRDNLRKREAAFKSNIQASTEDAKLNEEDSAQSVENKSEENK